MKSRSVRRHHEERIKRRVREHYGGVFRGDARNVGKLAHARTPCSCWMCGNPRRYEGEPTMRELRERADSDLIKG